MSAPVDTSVGVKTEADTLVPRRFRLVRRRQDTLDTATMWLEPVDGEALTFSAGQFTMLGAFGVGEVPISISGDPAEPSLLQHTIRDVGGVTRTLVAADPGDVLSVRGPYGRGWEVADGKGGDLVFVAGGIGLAPLRPAILDVLRERPSYGRVIVLYGARTPDELLFSEELERWRDRFDVDVIVTVDRADASWRGRVGLVTEPLSRIEVDSAGALAVVCGPEVMMRYVGSGLVHLGVPPDRVRISMERNMKCGVGLCGHCQLREHFICTDGPVFPFSVLERLMLVREL